MTDAAALPIQPGADGSLLLAVAAASASWRAPPSARPDLTTAPFLATSLLPVTRTVFDPQWRRVRDETLSRACATMLLGAAEPPSLALLQTVNRWVNRTIRYVVDPHGDAWSDAATTLRAGRGDCEDLAILKLQLLAALGLPREAMYLTLARDLIRRTDHAVLVVRLGQRHWMLDNRTEQVLDASRPHDYRAVMSFSGSRKWLHGQ